MAASMLLQAAFFFLPSILILAQAHTTCVLSGQGCFSAGGMKKIAVSGKMTLGMCASACHSASFSIAGISNDTCYCSSSLFGAAPLDRAMCPLPCPGNATQSCGNYDTRVKTVVTLSCPMRFACVQSTSTVCQPAPDGNFDSFEDCSAACPLAASPPPFAPSPPPPPPPPPPPSPPPTPEERARELLAQMTLDDKIAMVHGTAGPYTGNVAPNAALKIPALTLNDGRQGVRQVGAGATAWPCALAVTASWDRSLMYQFGVGMAEEFYGKGSNVALTPMLILARVPQGGRNFESVGEDPFLAGAMATNEITGIQSQHVIANADDFVLNNQETDRGSISAVADERSRFELYYPAYQAAVDAGVGSFMCSYNRVNGTYACENAETLNQDLKGRMGFKGWVVSDWGGTHSTVAAAVNGLDMEMPGGDFFNQALLHAVNQGQVPASRVDDMVLRILTPMFANGVFDYPSSGTFHTNVTSDAHNKLARFLGASGTVLLQNFNGLLPLSLLTPRNGNTAVRTIAVIGDDGDANPACCGTGSGDVTPPYVVTPFQGISARCGDACSVTYTRGPQVGVPLIQWYSQARNDHFLSPDCFECYNLYVEERLEGYGWSTCFGPDCEELLLYWNSDALVNYVTTHAHPPTEPGFTYVRTLAWALPLNYSGPLQTSILQLWVLDSPIAGNGSSSRLSSFTLASVASAQEASKNGYKFIANIARVMVSVPPGPDFSNIIAAAKSADVAVVCVSTPSGEGLDRTNLSLAILDDAMIEAVALAQPNTIVVLHNPGAVLMPWASQVSSILAAFFPGQEMGNSLADVLFGDVNPSARLPLSFPVREQDTPLSTPEQYPGVDGVCNYTEGLQIGYRWFEANDVRPLFPFGHGLSYSTFTYKNLTLNISSPTDAQHPDCVTPTQCSNTPAHNVHVHRAHSPRDEYSPWPTLGPQAYGNISMLACLDVVNNGPYPGKEIVQLYVEFPAAANEPSKLLKGFEAVFLPTEGAAAHVCMALSPRDLSVWDVPTHAWAITPGVYTVLIGASSQDIRLSAVFEL